MEYNNIFFDCDGVILNSNSLKSDAFLFAVDSYGKNYAKKLLKYHQENGGISRYEKFKFFLTNIINEDFCQNKNNLLLKKYSEYVKKGLLECEISHNLVENRARFKNTNWYIISGGDQAELRNIFEIRKLGILFNGGIYGSPRNKYKIFQEILSKINPNDKNIFLGDSLYDYQVASFFKIDFRYISKWSEFKYIYSHAQENNILVHEDCNSFFQEVQGGNSDLDNSTR